MAKKNFFLVLAIFGGILVASDKPVSLNERTEYECSGTCICGSGKNAGLVIHVDPRKSTAIEWLDRHCNSKCGEAEVWNTVTQVECEKFESH